MVDFPRRIHQLFLKFSASLLSSEISGGGTGAVHEVSLMKNLLAVVEKAAEREGSNHVDVIHLRLGEMSGVNIDSLKFAFEVLSEGTVAERGRLEFERIPLVIRCNECNYDSQPETLVFQCPKCGSAKMELISGREMEIDYILVDEGDPENESDSRCCGSE